ncbi:acyltransferase family protein [Salidesulfovibrio onnuriiensis]|uniref:acyltransferase family protein n=1 Tax=Salidesulfovibrio onnuriiensis TaxID=2583823 RepID=UPI00164F7436|nr:acyltransferase family protein [Salidesulfovibrio onnuriiensis]
MNKDRLHFLDNLRAAIIFAVILLHVSLCYMMYAPSWWYVINPETSIYFTYAVILIDVPIMPAMFFIAGYFALPSLQRQGTQRFMRSKFRRLLVPWALGVLLLAPPTAHMIYLSRHVPMDLLTFWGGEFWTKAFQQSVYWFLSILFWTFAAFALAAKALPALKNARQQVRNPSLPLFPAIIAGTGLAFYLAIRQFPVDGWYVSYLFSFQPERLPLLVGYFALGVWAWRNGWFTEEGYMPRKRIWLPLALLSALAYLAVKLGYGTPGAALFGRKDLLAPAFTIYCLSAMLGFIALFASIVNARGRVWASASDNSYGIYYVHALIAYWTAYLLLGADMSAYTKAAVALAVTCGASWMLSAGVLRRAPLLRKMF